MQKIYIKKALYVIALFKTFYTNKKKNPFY